VIAMTYEMVARFAQQGGSIYFSVVFVCVLNYALWPRNLALFDKAARSPLDEED